MKQILFGLLALGSMSSFAVEKKQVCFKENILIKEGTKTTQLSKYCSLTHNIDLENRREIRGSSDSAKCFEVSDINAFAVGLSFGNGQTSRGLVTFVNHNSLENITCDTAPFYTSEVDDLLLNKRLGHAAVIEVQQYEGNILAIE